MFKKVSIVLLIAVSLIALGGCASVEAEGEHGHFGVSTY